MHSYSNMCYVRHVADLTLTFFGYILLRKANLCIVGLPGSSVSVAGDRFLTLSRHLKVQLNIGTSLASR